MARTESMTVNVEVSIKPAKEFDAAALALGYAKARTCRKLPPLNSGDRYTLTAKYASGLEYSETLAYARCSECGTHFCDDFAYCPKCGAKVVDE